MVGPKFANTISAGNLIQIAAFLVTGVLAYSNVHNLSERNSAEIVRVDSNLSALAARVRDVERGSAEINARLTGVQESINRLLVTVDRIDTRLQRIEQGGKP